MLPQISVGDNFYDSGIDFTTGGILRFQEAWVDMYSQGVFDKVPWYQCLGNHDIVKGQSGVDFQTKVAPLYDDRWYFVSLEQYWKWRTSLLNGNRAPKGFRIIHMTSWGLIGLRLS
jgi:hypothetical protein